MATDTALVTQLTGQAWMRTADGALVPLAQGMRVPVEAEIVTADGATVQLQIDGVPPLTIGANRDMQLGDDVVQAQPEPAQAAAAPPEDLQMRALVTALNDGQDPFADLDATAAVATGGGEGGGSFSRLLNVIELTSPLDLAYPRPTPVPTEDVLLPGGATGAAGEDGPLAAAGDAGTPAAPAVPGDSAIPVVPGEPDPAAPVDPVEPPAPPVPPVPVPPVVPPIPAGPFNTPPQAATVNLAFANEDDEDIVGLDVGQHFSDPDGDRLTYTATGLPPGLTLDPDSGIITGKLDNSASQGGNGGVYNVVVKATDPSGDSATITFDWTVTNPGPDAEKDEGTTSENVVLEVKAEDGLLKNDTDKDGDDLTVTGILHNGALVPAGTPLVIPGQGTLTVQPDGSYTFNPGSDFDYLAVGEEAKVTYTYQITDGEEGFDTAELVITITGTNDAPVISAAGTDAAASVTEIGDNAAGENSTLHSRTGTITFVDADSSDNGHVATVVPKANGFLGDLTLGALDPATGTVPWTFQVADSVIDYLNAGESLIQAYEVTVDDGKGGKATQVVTITIVGTNDVPTITSDAVEHAGAVHENAGAGESGTATGTLSYKDDDTSHKIQWALVTDPADAASTLAPTIQGQYGTMALNAATGKWEYTLDDANPAVNALGDTDSLTETFTARVTDDQGTYSQQIITITIHGKEDGVPGIVAEDDNGAGVAGQITVSEKGLPGGSGTLADATKDGSITITAGDGLSSVKIGGQEFTLAQLQVLLAGNPSAPIRVGPGEIVLTGFTATASVGGVPTAATLSYTYTLVDAKTHKDVGGNPLDSLTTDVALAVTDAKGVTRTGTLTVNVEDDAPDAKNDTHAVAEGTAGAAAPAIQGNILAGSGNTGDVRDVQGADTAKVSQVAGAETKAVGDADVVVKGQYGTLTIKSDGGYSYQLDDDNAAVNALKGAQGGAPAQTLDEVFTYTLTDADGDADTATLTITITGATDGPPAIDVIDRNGAVDGHITVSEKGLDGGSGNPQDARANGGIKVTAPEGLTSIVIVDKDGNDIVLNLDALNGLGSNPREIDVGHGKIVLTGFTPNTLEAGKTVVSGELTYTYTLGGTRTHDSADAHGDVSVGLKVRDAAGGEANGRLLVNVLDDAPDARDDAREVKAGTWLLDGQAGNVTSNDVKGADGAKVTQVAGAETKAVGDSDITVRGEYGTLTIKSDGSYSYVRDAGSKGGVSDVFTYTLTDGDGDIDTATLTINIADAAAGITGLTASSNDGDVTVREQHLAGGTQADTSALTQQGTFTISAPDGIASLKIGGQAIVLDNVTQTLPVITTPLGNTLAIKSYDAATGVVTYTYTLNENETHASGGGKNNLFEDFAITLVDQDGDTANGTLSVRIVDDVPVVTVDAAALGSVTVDETNLNTLATADFSGAFAIAHGADGRASTDHTVFSLAVNPAVSSGLKDTATGHDIVLVDNNGTIEGRVGTATGELAFTVSVDGGTGLVTLQQARALRHGDTNNHDETATLNPNAIVLKATATDTDGDSASASIGIGGKLGFKDDGPSIEAKIESSALPDALNTRDADTIGANTGSASASFKDVFVVKASDAGADGTHSTVWTYALGLNSAQSGLSSAGQPIMLSGSGGTITGTAGGKTIFTIGVAADGTVTLRQYEAIDHPDKGSGAAQHADLVSLDGKITLTGSATITDGDGDKASHAQTLDIGDRFTFTDQGPAIGSPADATVHEKFLSWGSEGGASGATTVAGGSLGVTFGADSTAGADTYFTSDAVAALKALGLKSGQAELSYDLSNGGHTLTATAGGKTVFVIDIKDWAGDGARYEFSLQAALDHVESAGHVAQIVLKDIPFTVKDADGDTASSQFSVTITDDTQAADRSIETDEDKSITFNTTADGTGATVTVPPTGVQGAPGYGTVTIDANGKITYTPKPDYSGPDTFTYTTVEGGVSTTTTVTVHVKPVADAPTVGRGSQNVFTTEDKPIALGLKVPVVKDGVDKSGSDTDDHDSPERLGFITLSGFRSGSKLLVDGTAYDVPSGNIVRIILSDVLHVAGNDGAGRAGVLTMTSTQFAALQVLPPAEEHQNFTVTMKVTSYEVDQAGARLSGIGGAESSTTVNVRVQAVTDPVELKINGGNSYSATINEDSPIDLAALMGVSYPNNDGNAGHDLDGSEKRWFEISGLPVGAWVNGTEIKTAGQVVVIEAPGLSKSNTGLPAISIKPPADFSGDITGVKVVLKAQDQDADGIGDRRPDGSVIPTAQRPTKGDIEESEVTLNLHVKPVAGDVVLEGSVSTQEDTAVTFLAGVTVTDQGSGTGAGGNETVTGLVVKAVPAGWIIKDGNGAELFTGNGTSDYLVPNVSTDAWRGYTITPPPHSSKDATIRVDVTTTDTNTVNGVAQSDTKTTPLDIAVKVTPVAERLGVDSDSLGGDDVTMTGGHTYAGRLGAEDGWFHLSQGGFQLQADWANADGDERFYALFKPVLKAGVDGESAVGAQLKYLDTDTNEVKTLTFDGSTPIQVPVKFLSSLEFKAPLNVAGEFQIQVGVRTVDYDDDAEGQGTPVQWSQENVAQLDGILIKPVADGIESLSVGGVKGRAEGLEDSLVALSIRPSSLDKSEVFTVEIGKIPVGAVLYYGVDASGNPVPVVLEQVTDGAGNVVGQTVTIENFDQTLPLHILPPQDSNADFALEVRSRTVDSLPDGSKDVSDWISKPLPVRVKGDADGVTGGKIVGGKYDLSDVAQKDVKLTEDSLTKISGQPSAQADTNRILLSSLIVAAALTLKDADGSEALSLKLTGLHKDFDLKGDNIVFLGGEGEGRAWLLQIADASQASIQDLLDKTAIQVPTHFSGKVDAKLVVVTTEDDGDYLSGEVALSAEVTPQVDATVSGKSVIIEDQKTKVVFALNHNGDADETLTAVYIKKDDVATQQQFASGSKPFILFLGDKALSEAGVNTETKDGVEYYVLRGDDIHQVAAQAKSQFAHNQADAQALAFDVRYEITDHPSHDGAGQPAPAVTLLPEETHSLEVTAQTDQALATLAEVSIDAAVGSFSDAGSALEINGTGAFGVKIQLTSPDADGSEQVVRLQVDGVPDGLTVTGLTIGGVAVDNVTFLGGSAWLVTVPKDLAVFADTSGVEATVQFHAGEFLSSQQAGANITIKALTQDAGAAVVSSNAVSLALTADIVGGGGGVGADRVQVTLHDKAFQHGVEDKPFLLSDALSATLEHGSNARVTLMLTLPETAQVARLEGGSAVSLVSTTVAGKEVWFISGPADALNTLLDSIQITPPANLNSNTGGSDWLGVKVTAYDAGNGSQSVDDIQPLVPLMPVTDAAQVDIAFSAVDADGQALGRQPQEGDSVGIKVSVSNPVDGDTALGDTLYVKLAAGNLDGGSLWHNGVELTAVTIAAGLDPVGNPLGLEPGTYYVVPLDAVTLTAGSPSHAVDLVYKPAPGKEFTSGSLVVQAWVQNTETGSDLTTVASNVQEGQIADKDKVDLEAVNNGFAFDVGALVGGKWVVDGQENPGGEGEGRIRLGISAPGLVDTDGSEVARIALLKSLPKDFLVYFGADESSAKLANNVGSNDAPEWTIPMTDNKLPAYIAVVPPRNWSGKVDGVELSVLSGEKTLTPQPNDPKVVFDLQVAAVADGVLSLNPAAAFGPEGEIITLNLNLVMADGSKAQAGVEDTSIETTSLTLKGLGSHAAFYVVGQAGTKVLLENVAYDLVSDTYTLVGLTQAQVDSLGFVQSASAPAGGKVQINAWTVEADGGRSALTSGEFDLSIRNQGAAGGGNDRLLFDGFNPLDGGAGEDTVWLRLGQDLDFSGNVALRNIETIDLTRTGFGHTLSNLSAEDVASITDARNSLTIKADGDDTINLADGWTRAQEADGYDVYTSEVNGAVVELRILKGATVTGDVLEESATDGSVDELLGAGAPMALRGMGDDFAVGTEERSGDAPLVGESVQSGGKDATPASSGDAAQEPKATDKAATSDAAGDGKADKDSGPGKESAEKSDADKPQAAPAQAPSAGWADADASGHQNQMVNDLIQQGRLQPDI